MHIANPPWSSPLLDVGLEHDVAGVGEGDQHRSAENAIDLVLRKPSPEAYSYERKARRVEDGEEVGVVRLPRADRARLL